MFEELWPGFDAAEVPIGSITNGVHGPTWAAPEWASWAWSSPARTRRCGSRRSGNGWGRSTPVISGGSVRQLRAKLVEDVRRRLRQSWLERGAIEAELGWIDRCFRSRVC